MPLSNATVAARTTALPVCMTSGWMTQILFHLHGVVWCKFWSGISLKKVHWLCVWPGGTLFTNVSYSSLFFSSVQDIVTEVGWNFVTLSFVRTYQVQQNLVGQDRVGMLSSCQRFFLCKVSKKETCCWQVLFSLHHRVLEATRVVTQGTTQPSRFPWSCCSSHPGQALLVRIGTGYKRQWVTQLQWSVQRRSFSLLWEHLQMLGKRAAWCQTISVGKYYGGAHDTNSWWILLGTFSFRKNGPRVIVETFLCSPWHGICQYFCQNQYTF